MKEQSPDIYLIPICEPIFFSKGAIEYNKIIISCRITFSFTKKDYENFCTPFSSSRTWQR